jgi:hypothetical protein
VATQCTKVTTKLKLTFNTTIYERFSINSQSMEKSRSMVRRAQKFKNICRNKPTMQMETKNLLGNYWIWNFYRHKNRGTFQFMGRGEFASCHQLSHCFCIMIAASRATGETYSHSLVMEQVDNLKKTCAISEHVCKVLKRDYFYGMGF